MDTYVSHWKIHRVKRRKRKLEYRKELNEEKREGKKREARQRFIKSGKKD